MKNKPLFTFLCTINYQTIKSVQSCKKLTFSSLLGPFRAGTYSDHSLPQVHQVSMCSWLVNFKFSPWHPQLDNGQFQKCMVGQVHLRNFSRIRVKSMKKRAQFLNRRDRKRQNWHHPHFHKWKKAKSFIKSAIFTPTIRIIVWCCALTNRIRFIPIYPRRN